MANVLFHTLVFPPDSVSTSILLGDLAQELTNLGHTVTVLTTSPHYNQDKDAFVLQPLHKKWAGLFYKSNYFGISVYHVSMPAKGKSIFSRLFNYLRFHILSLIVDVIYTSLGYDLIITPSPPLTIGFSAWLLGLRRKVPFIYNVQEIYPDIAIKLGFLRNQQVIRMLELMELFIYKRARIVVVISDSFQRRLLSKGVPSKKLCVIPNFVDIEFIKPGAKINDFSHTYKLNDQFIILYAGNIGLTQDFETIIEAAENLKHFPDLRFLIVGNGVRQTWLKKELEEKQLLNVTLLAYQPHSSVPEMYSTSDLCLVPLKKNTAIDTFPSKIYTIMAAGRPAIVSADNESDLTPVVKKSGCGLIIQPEDIRAMINAIEFAYHHRDEIYKMGRRGRKYVVNHHNRQAIGFQYHKLINKILLSKQ